MEHIFLLAQAAAQCRELACQWEGQSLPVCVAGQLRPIGAGKSGAGEKNGTEKGWNKETGQGFVGWTWEGVGAVAPVHAESQAPSLA